jgi:hypothetical protein
MVIVLFVTQGEDKIVRACGGAMLGVRARERGREKGIGGVWEGVGGEVRLEGGRGGEAGRRKDGERKRERNRGMKPLHTTP